MWELNSSSADQLPLVSPLVSIVTPCLNFARFIEETLQSVAAQDYPNLEHIVVDGGSTDGTLEILARYPNVTVLTGRDRGAADAINRGFDRSHGEFFTWLNADDLLLPGAIRAAVEALQNAPDAGGVYGEGRWIDERGARLDVYPTRDFDARLLERECFICQPASVMRSEAFLDSGRLNPDFDLTFDYELWMRLTRKHTLKRISTPMAYSRMHQSNKSLGQRDGVFRETFQVLRLHYGYVPFHWIYGYACYLADKRDQFFEPLQPSVARYLRSLPMGLSLNHGARMRYFAEWLSVMSWSGLRRRLINP